MITKKPIRLMSWNLLEGGHTPHTLGGVPTQDIQRIQAAQELIKESQADIVVINEALWCEPHEGHHTDYADLFNFPHQAGHLYDAHWGNVILSKFPITASKTFSIYNRGGMVVEIQTPQGLLQVATYHPHPSRWAFNKAQDYQSLVRISQNDKPLLVCGDFNAISPEDKPDAVALAEAFSAFSKNPERDSARFIDGGEAIFPVLEMLGFKDAIIDRKPSMPTALVASNDTSGMRIDHAWVNRNIKVKHGCVVHDYKADIASDHYPLLVDLSLT